MHKIVDCFPFFNEKELLELRVNMLKDYVDHFIISEANYTHSGKPREFQLKKLIEELGLPKDMITVLEVNIPPEEEIEANYMDALNSAESKSPKEIKAWSRERLQRDSLQQCIDDYSDDTVFVIGDCDEIIKPQDLKYFASVCRNKNCVVKVPLVMLEGSANMRLYNGSNPIPWSMSLFLCTKLHLKEVTPTNIRSGVDNKFGVQWITENGQQIQDCGWHFTWMGDEERRKAKAESFIHYANINSVNTLSSTSLKKISNNSNNYILKRYPNSELPKEIFELERVKKFLIGETNFTHLV